MFKGTTPVVRWSIKPTQLDLDDIESVWMTVKDKSKTLTIKEDDLVINKENKYIQYTFTQQQTLDFKGNVVYMQLRILLENGQALASEIKEVTVKEILQGGVIS